MSSHEPDRDVRHHVSADVAPELYESTQGVRTDE